MGTIGTETDYRKILRTELETRLSRREGYSLRAFAAELGLAPSRLSEILGGKQGLSRKSAESVAEKLGLSDGDLALFCDLVESRHARNQAARDLARLRLERARLDSVFHTVGLDAFQVVADWYHFAIIELTSLEGFSAEPAWIARRLGITRAEARAAVARLKRLGLVEDKGGRLVATRDYVATSDGVPSEAIRKFHRQVLVQALEAIDAQDVARRNLSAVFVPIDRARVPEAARWIRNFRRRFLVRAGAAGPKDSLYCLSVQFFELTKESP